MEQHYFTGQQEISQMFKIAEKLVAAGWAVEVSCKLPVGVLTTDASPVMYNMYLSLTPAS